MITKKKKKKKSHNPDSIFIRSVTDADTKPKVQA